MAVVRFDFMARCLSAGNDSGFIKLIDPDQHRHLAPNQAQADEALLPIVLTVVLPGYHRKIERVVAVGEIYLMLAKVRLALLGVVSHRSLIVYALNQRVQHAA